MLKLNTFLPIHLTFFFFYTLSLIAGIWWQSSSCGPTYAASLCLLIIVGYVYSFGMHKKTIIHIAMLICLFCLGAYRFAHHMNQFNDFYEMYDNVTCDIEGTIVEIETLNRPRFSQLITLQTSSIKTHDRVCQNIDSIVLQIYSKTATDMHWNDKVLIKNITIKKPNSSNYENYLHKEGVASSLFAYHLDYTVLERRQSLITRIKTTRQRIILSCKEKMSDTTFALFCAIFAGNKTILKKNVFNSYKEQFKWWGISHHLARSGLHLVLFSLLLNASLLFFPLPFLIKQFLIFFIILLYSLLS